MPAGVTIRQTAVFRAPGTPMGNPVNKRIVTVLSLPLLTAGVLALAACNDKGGDQPTAPASTVYVPVPSASTTTEVVPVPSESVSVEPSASVSVSPSDETKNDVKGDGGE